LGAIDDFIHAVNAASRWDESYRSYPRRSAGCVAGSDNPYSDVWLNWQKSAEAIVSRQFGRRAEQQRFWKLERFEGNTKKADNFMWT